jgi:adenosylmethionine-8-amino-7-oxononanoate aminotransferase
LPGGETVAGELTPNPAGDSSEQQLLDWDRRHVWHPYGPMPAAVTPLRIESAEGVRLRLADGREVVDGMSSWWCALHGYRNPVLDSAVTEQLGRMSHVMFGGLTHEPAIRLAERLVEMTPDPLEHVFFADSGSVSVEVAIKMCLQARQGRPRLLALRGGYHGDTFGAMSVCDPVGGMHSLFSSVLPQQVFADRPPREMADDYADHLTGLVERHADELAAVIVEPVVQGAGGMWFYDPAVLRLLRELCDRHGILLVFDEIATGFGRTGTLFGMDHAGVVPDVLCVGKALTGGYMTLAATLCTAAVAAEIEGGALMHGPTFMGNPLACSVALASTGLIVEGGWREDVPRIESGLRAGLEPLRERPGIADVRVMGAIGVVELERDVDMAAATAAAVENGAWLRPFRNLVYAMPPYVTGEEDLAVITGAIAAAAEASLAATA